MKKRTLISAILVIALCFTAIAGSTFALFTSETKVNVAVGAANVSVVAAMKDGSLKTYTSIWNENTGAYESIEVSADQQNNKVFPNGGTVVADDSTNTITIDKMTPMDKVTFVITVTNNSDVAIKYQTIVSQIATVVGADGTTLLDGLVITVEGDETVKVGNNAVTNWKSDFASGETRDIAVSIELPEAAGNQYQGLAAEISYVVNAVQGTAHVENPVADEEDETTYIYTLNDLYAFAAAVNGGDTFKAKDIKLMANLDLGNAAWTPIGNSTNKFMGNFDGGNFVISNLKTGDSATSHVGFFGYTTNPAVIKNLTIHNADVEGDLYVGVVAGTPYTAKWDNITVTGDVTVDGFSYVGGMFGKSLYANANGLTMDVNEGSYVKADSIEYGAAVDGSDDLCYRTYVGGIVGFMGEGGHTVSNVYSNIDVYGTTCDVGGITGIAHYGNNFVNCVVEADVTITDYRDEGDQLEIGGIAGVWHNSESQVTLTNCSFTGKLTALDHAGKAYEGEFHNNGLVGKAYSASGAGKLIIDGSTSVVTKAPELIADTLTSNEEVIHVTLGGDTNVPISSLGQMTGGSGEYKLGGEDTKEIVIDLGGKTLCIDTTYWSVLSAKNPDATLIIKNGTLTSSQTSGTWNSYNLCFNGCNLVIENVVFEKAIAIENAGKTSTLRNVTINETHDYYALWITAEGQTVNLENVTINSAGRAIKIADEYCEDSTARVTLNIKDCKFTSNKKAAVLVASPDGADINIDGLDISAVAADTTNYAWKDNGKDAWMSSSVTVNGVECIVEP